jgi:hypothetical protein
MEKKINFIVQTIQITCILFLHACYSTPSQKNDYSKISLGTQYFKIDSSNWVKKITVNYFQKSTNFKINKGKTEDVIISNYKNQTEFYIEHLKLNNDFIIKIFGGKTVQIHYFSQIKIVSGHLEKTTPNRLIQYKHNGHWHKGINCDFNLTTCDDI